MPFHSKAYINLSRVCMNDYNKFNSRKRTIRMASKVAQTSTEFPTKHRPSYPHARHAQEYTICKTIIQYAPR